MTWPSTRGCGRPTGSTTSRHGRVDAEVAIERGDHVLEVDRAIGGAFAQPVGRADDLAGLHAAAGQECAADLRPVVAAGTIVDLRRAAEFAPGDDRHIVEHAADVEIFDQGAQALIELAAVIAHQVEVLAVAVPAAEAERDAADARPRPAGGPSAVDR